MFITHHGLEVTSHHCFYIILVSQPNPGMWWVGGATRVCESLEVGGGGRVARRRDGLVQARAPSSLHQEFQSRLRHLPSLCFV